LSGRQVFANALHVRKVTFLVTLEHRTEAIDTILVLPVISDLLDHLEMFLK
jgi:hypothetical protein